MTKFEVICINAKNKPADFPANLWIHEEVEVYKVTCVSKMALQPGVYGFVLAERTLPPHPFKYDTFDSRRFRPATEQDYLALEAVTALLEEVEERELITLD